MKTKIILLCAWVMVHVASAQQFQKKLNIQLDPGTQIGQALWIDLDNDSLLDIVVSSTFQNQVSILAYKNLLQGPAQKVNMASTNYSTAKLSATDFNLDNKIDLVVSGTISPAMESTEAFLNQGGFVFQRTNSNFIHSAAAKLQFVELNNDGQKDAVMIRNSQTLTAFKNKNQSFAILFDSGNLRVHDFAVADFDGNGFNDIAISGRNQMNQVILRVIEFQSRFDTLRTIHLPLAVDGTVETGDLNQDGFPDMVVSGHNNAGNLVAQTYINQDSIFAPGASFAGLQNAVIRIADFDSDGKVDISFFGGDNGGQLLNWIHTFTEDSLLLPSAHVIDQIAGDYDRDGDLDLLQVTDTLGLVVLENLAPARNRGPSNAYNPIAVQLLSKLFMYWEKPNDDHTATPSITFDLALSAGSQEVLSGEFDKNQLHRLTVSPGSQGTNNYALLTIPVAQYTFEIQSIDNAFVSTTSFGTCNGSSQSCASITLQSITSCDNKPALLTESSKSLWFSFSKGFLGKSDTLKINAAQADTVFSFLPQQHFSCATIKLYSIQHSTDTLFIQTNHAFCDKDTLHLSVGDEWQNVLWKNAARHQIATGNSILYQASNDDIITATGNNNRGCNLKQQETITISKPVLGLNGDDFQILKGNSVSLVASGGVTYEWTPATGLDRTDIPDPVASPTVTTRYTVTVTDSIGCTIQGSVLVEVSATAFIANLFTPNGDGKNDALKIFGLSGAHNFHFWIYKKGKSLMNGPMVEP